MGNFYEEALKADGVEIKETLKGYVSQDGNGSFEAVLSMLADIAKEEGEQASFTDTPTDKLGENMLELAAKIREGKELAVLSGI